MLFPIYNLEVARRTILKRQPWAAATYPASLLEGITRIFGQAMAPEQAVARILADVQARGDAAAIHWSRAIDGAATDELLVPQSERQEALRRIDPGLRQALELAAERIAAFHRRQPVQSWLHTDEQEGSLGQLVQPLASVGVYVPGGTAPLPSSLLMAAVIARVAGVETIIACSPPDRAAGRVPDVILAAAEIAGVEALYALGGAQAIAALAYGTETIPKVDKIVGPGGLFVTLAKRQVFGAVGIEGLPGPTETVVIADGGADPGRVAADLLAQAEHDVLATAILLTPSRTLAETVRASIGRRLEGLSRADIIAVSLQSRGGAVITPDLQTALQAANDFAPEHLCLSVANPWQWLPQVRHAGGVFLGEHSFEVLGDYVAGPSHVMPTEGTARFASPLNVEDFVRRISVIGLSPAASAQLSPIAARLAAAEGLDAHAAAARERMPDDPGSAAIGADLRAPADIAHLLRPDVLNLEAYTPVQPFEVLSRRLGRSPEDIVKLDANENPYGPSPRALAALQRFPWYHIYPDAQQEELRQALSAYVGVPADYILPGHGADELLDLLCRLFVAPGDAIITCPPTFGMYSFDARLSGGRVVEVWRQPDFSLDVDGIEEVFNFSQRLNTSKPKLLFLCSPNNPDGSLIPHDVLRRLLQLPLVVVVDEAYVEFAAPDASVARWAPQTSNLVVLRTFSKWAGLAGLRLGYGIFPLALMEHLWRFKQPYNVNVAATCAGLASLQDLPLLQERVALLKTERERLYTELAAFPFLQPLPSQSNFVLCRVEGRAALELQQRLAAGGVLVRYYDKPGLRNTIRISAGRPQDTDRLLAALREL